MLSCLHRFTIRYGRTPPAAAFQFVPESGVSQGKPMIHSPKVSPSLATNALKPIAALQLLQRPPLHPIDHLSFRIPRPRPFQSFNWSGLSLRLWTIRRELGTLKRCGASACAFDKPSLPWLQLIWSNHAFVSGSPAANPPKSARI
jgi:hypothetical protein